MPSSVLPSISVKRKLTVPLGGLGIQQAYDSWRLMKAPQMADYRIWVLGHNSGVKKKSDFDTLLDSIEAEAKAEGDGAVQELQALTDYYSVFNQFLELRKKRKDRMARRKRSSLD